mmetsp:Transcript_100792/g.284244  ORF Transcript_100792/g.284244 Transcript_100792/m.284244 type:complete len:251 (-) Transcript_100792:1460-2212(-)
MMAIVDFGAAVVFPTLTTFPPIAILLVLIDVFSPPVQLACIFSTLRAIVVVWLIAALRTFFALRTIGAIPAVVAVAAIVAIKTPVAVLRLSLLSRRDFPHVAPVVVGAVLGSIRHSLIRCAQLNLLLVTVVLRVGFPDLSRTFFPHALFQSAPLFVAALLLLSSASLSLPAALPRHSICRLPFPFSLSFSFSLSLPVSFSLPLPLAGFFPSMALLSLLLPGSGLPASFPVPVPVPVSFTFSFAFSASDGL